MIETDIFSIVFGTVVVMMAVMFAASLKQALTTFKAQAAPPEAAPEPDAVTRLAAIADPESDAADRVRAYEAWIAHRNEVMNRVFGAASDIAKRVGKIK